MVHRPAANPPQQQYAVTTQANRSPLHQKKQPQQNQSPLQHQQNQYDVAFAPIEVPHQNGSKGNNGYALLQPS